MLFVSSLAIFIREKMSIFARQKRLLVFVKDDVIVRFLCVDKRVTDAHWYKGNWKHNENAPVLSEY